MKPTLRLSNALPAARATLPTAAVAKRNATPQAAQEAPQGDIPCPYLRALEKAGHIGPRVPVGQLGGLTAQAFGRSGIGYGVLATATASIASFANGITSIPRNLYSGMRPHELRGGPLDKQGGGTRILSQKGEFDPAEFARFLGFAAEYPKADGSGTERGWGAPELEKYLDANQQRGHGGWLQRHVIMEGELPQLLQLMGQGEGAAKHLVPHEVQTLFVERKLPERVEARIANAEI